METEVVVMYILRKLTVRETFTNDSLTLKEDPKYPEGPKPMRDS